MLINQELAGFSTLRELIGSFIVLDIESSGSQGKKKTPKRNTKKKPVVANKSKENVLSVSLYSPVFRCANLFRIFVFLFIFYWLFYLLIGNLIGYRVKHGRCLKSSARMVMVARKKSNE